MAAERLSNHGESEWSVDLKNRYAPQTNREERHGAAAARNLLKVA
jgi:hypothetical protein